jgi:hypothetical protein
MDKNRTIARSLALVVALPYLVPALTNKPTPDAPKRVTFIALQNLAVSTSTATIDTLVLDTMLGREISVAAAFDEHPRPAFIAPKLTSSTLAMI